VKSGKTLKGMFSGGGSETMCEIKDKIIYVAAPYGGDEVNKEKVERLIRELVQIYLIIVLYLLYILSVFYIMRWIMMRV
jgi:hypothetical protein